MTSTGVSVATTAATSGGVAAASVTTTTNSASPSEREGRPVPSSATPLATASSPVSPLAIAPVLPLALPSVQTLALAPVMAKTYGIYSWSCYNHDVSSSSAFYTMTVDEGERTFPLCFPLIYLSQYHTTTLLR